MIELPEGEDFVLEAAWFWSGEGEPVQNVAIEISHRSIIADIRPLRSTQSRLAIIPLLTNAHTHLELSDIEEPFPPGEVFPDWIQKVIAHRNAREDEADALKIGLREVQATGTAFIADTVPMGQSGTSSGTDFIEYIGLTDERVQSCVQHAARLPTGIGYSPHAPYSARFDLVEQLVDIAVSRRVLPVMMHLAETREEIELLERGTGPFADMLKSFGIWEPGLFPKHTLCDYIDCLSQANRTLLAHGNYLGDREIELLATKPETTVVFCPRTHRHFGHANHPWRKLLANGVEVALGTDSRASNPDLSVWNEAKFMVEHHGCEPMLALRMATTALALGPTKEFRLVPACTASFSVLEVLKPLSDFAADAFSQCVPIGARLWGKWVTSQAPCD